MNPLLAEHSDLQLHEFSARSLPFSFYTSFDLSAIIYLIAWPLLLHVCEWYCMASISQAVHWTVGAFALCQFKVDSGTHPHLSFMRKSIATLLKWFYHASWRYNISVYDYPFDSKTKDYHHRCSHEYRHLHTREPKCADLTRIRHCWQAMVLSSCFVFRVR